MAVFSMAGGNPALPTYPLQRSVRLRLSAGGYFNRTPATATNRRTFTWSGWVKRGILGTISGTAMDMFGIRIDTNNQFRLYFNTSDQIDVYSQVSAAIGGRLITNAVYRDPSAWYHIVLTVDTTNATAGDRMRLYINGVEVTSFNTDTQPSLNYDTYVNTVNTHYMGYFSAAAFDGYLAEVNFIDGQALTPSSFGAYNSYGVWSPAKYTGTYGTNGFYLNFQDNSALTTTANVGIGKDSSGNGNYWTSNNISITAGTTYDSMLDVPTLTSATNANYATLNPVYVIPSNTANTFTNGNLTFAPTQAEGTGTASAVSSMPLPTTGKWYWEITPSVVSTLSSTRSQVGIMARAQISYVPALNSDCFVYVPSGQKATGNVYTAYGNTYAANDVIGVAVDLDNGAIYFAKNGTWQNSGVPTSGASKTGAAFTTLTGASEYFPAVGYWGTFNANFGQQPFSYTPPTGYNRLCTYNLPDSIVPVGAQYMAATLYTGTGAAQSITNTVNGTSLQPDFVWMKQRSAINDHILMDSVRGVTKAVFSNLTNAEVTDATRLTSFNSNGFTLGTSASTNTNAGTYVGWQWRASNASAVTNTSGSITSQVSANQTAGFSIVTYTGTGANATVGHGLGAPAKMLIIKRRDSTSNWTVLQTSISGSPDNFLYLNSTSAVINAGVVFNGVTPTSTIFGLGTDASVNASGGTFVAYCFAAVPGYSAFGKYTGNGSADGPFVFTNFRPRWIMWKRTDTTGSWYLYDTSRSTYNASVAELYPNLSNAEANSATGIDILSNGWKIRTSGAGDPQVNASGGTYIYAAFAENPFKNALAR